MPLMRPEIQAVLREAGLIAPIRSEDKRPLSEKLDSAGLSLSDTLDKIALLAEQTNNDSLRARLLETVLKMHGSLKESAPAPPSFTIVIQESSSTSLAPSINLPSGVNPILLPRALLKELSCPAVASGERSIANQDIKSVD